MKKGLYYIGDLCYVVKDHDFWLKICDESFSENFNGFFKTIGLDMYMHGTRMGDGAYEDNFGNIYGVDSGTIGCVRLDEHYDELVKQGKVEPIENIKNMGLVKEFEKDFNVLYVEVLDEHGQEVGIFHFGKIQIYT